MQMIKVKASRPHHNEFGDSFEKAKDATYDAPPLAAQSLKANGLVTYVDTKAANEALALVGLKVEAAPTPAK